MLVAGLDPLRYAWTQCEVIVHYLRLSLWPHPLVFDYAWPTSGSLSSVLPSVAIVLALLAGTVVMLVRRMWWGPCVARTGICSPKKEVVRGVDVGTADRPDR